MIFAPCPRRCCRWIRNQKHHRPTHGHDKYKHTIGDVFLSNRMNLNQDLVKQGWWWYRMYALEDTVLEGLETAAREARKGLWADPQPVPPWEWRKRNR